MGMTQGLCEHGEQTSWHNWVMVEDSGRAVTGAEAHEVE